jgi:hypothetical protein
MRIVIAAEYGMREKGGSCLGYGRAFGFGGVNVVNIQPEIGETVRRYDHISEVVAAMREYDAIMREQHGDHFVDDH